jgi:O-antigen/teichoic acid export membrane protein
MAGLAACAEPMIRFLLTDKWVPCVPYLRLFCLYYAIWPLHTANLNAIKATGHSGIFLELEIIKKLVETAILLVTMRYGVMAITVGLLVSGFSALLINAWPNRRLLGYSIPQQIRDALPAVLLSAVMGLAITPISWTGLPDLVKLLLMVPAGVAVYVGGSLLFKLESFQYILDVVKKMLRRGKEEA